VRGTPTGWVGRLACLCLAVMAGDPAAAEAPRRIVSINLCADHYLLALADREDIAALSPFADDRSMSTIADEAEGLPEVRDDAESVLALGPDLVMASVYTRPSTLALLRRRGIDLALVPHARDFDELKRQIGDVAEMLDAERSGAALSRELDAALNELHGAGQGRSALYLDRGGFLSRGDSLIGALFRHAGLTNLAGGSAGGFAAASLEEIVAMRPDLLVTPGGGSSDQGGLAMRHPVLSSLTGMRLVELPAPETVCPGPSWIAAIRRLTHVLRASDGDLR
jgi:iron complex transport system substrate-binding protein